MEASSISATRISCARVVVITVLVGEHTTRVGIATVESARIVVVTYDIYERALSGSSNARVVCAFVTIIASNILKNRAVTCLGVTIHRETQVSIKWGAGLDGPISGKIQAAITILGFIVATISRETVIVGAR